TFVGKRVKVHRTVIFVGKRVKVHRTVTFVGKRVKVHRTAIFVVERKGKYELQRPRRAAATYYPLKY
ncbi:MAG: hypothetical protein RI894_839, partial [Bacteroidota bacterium]